jgi:hypothetical protein
MTSRELELLEELQRALEGFYRLEPAPGVASFLIEIRVGSASRETLYLVEEEDLFLGLALDPALGSSLQGSCLAEAELAAFCTLVEGISHYLFVFYCARERRSVSGLELELQGEIDKYVACTFLIRRAPELSEEVIRSRLYEGFRLVDGLDAALAIRYSLANALARRYTGWLEQRFVRGLRGLAAMILELRRFYRLGYARKRELIGR